jgi:ABC-2 type transport system permease protein
MTTEGMTTGPGEVFDLGYRGYEGERTGRWSRRRAIWRDGIRISLGLGRGLGAKVVSWLLIGLALVPIVVLVVVSAFLSPIQEARSDFELPSYGDYYEWAHVPLGLFAAVVAPLLLCPDRRDGVLSLYAARPITPTDYVGSRWAAFLTVLAVGAWSPPAILFTWNALDASSPGSWLADNWDVVPRFLAAGATVALVLTTISLFAASFATRRAYASVAILAGLFVGSAIGGIAEESFSGPLSDALSLASIPQALVDSVHWTFGDPLDRPLPGWVSTLWLAGLTVVLGVWLLRRTERLVRG